MKRRIFIRTIFILLYCIALLHETSGAENVQDFKSETWLKPWLCIGPFPDPDRKGHDTDFFPNVGGEEKVCTNFLVTLDEVHKTSPALSIVSVDTPESGLVDFVSIYGEKENSVAYAWTSFSAAVEGCSMLRLGSDDGIKVWLNGSPVHHNWLYRSAHPDSDIVSVHIKKGVNSLLVKVTQGGGDWGFYLRFSEIVTQKQGVYLKVVRPVELPVLLVGSKIPIQQSLNLTLFNFGNTGLDDLNVLFGPEGYQNIEPLSLSINCPACKLFDIEVPFVLPTGIGPDARLTYTAKYIKSDGSRVQFAAFPTSTALAHPLLREMSGVQTEPFFIIQITDPHIVERDTLLNGVNTTERLITAIREINAMSPLPDFVIVTGDILLDQHQGYALFEEIISELQVPFLVTFGNHDKPLGLPHAHRTFSEWGLPPYYAFVHKGKCFIILDTVVGPHPVVSSVSEPQLRWLETVLKQETGYPRLFFMHHDLFSGRGVNNYEQVQSLIDQYPGEKWFFSGHWHCDCFLKRKNERHIISSATAYLFPGEAKFKHARAMPGFRIIKFHDDKITTQFKPLGKPPVDDPPFDEFYTFDELKEVLNR